MEENEEEEEKEEKDENFSRRCKIQFLSKPFQLS